MFSRLVLLLPGSIDYTQFNNFFNHNDYIIAVDGGIEHSLPLKIKPNLWVGDFDSCQQNSRTIFADIPTEEFSIDKDYLDTELALNKAKELNISECVMLGGIGGRLDHQMGLFMILLNYSELRFTHTDGQTCLYSLNNQTALNITAKTAKHLSIIPITELKNVSISGVKWPLDKISLLPGKGLSISNEPIRENIIYSQENGLGWLILS